MKKLFCMAALAAMSVFTFVGCSTTSQGKISADIVYRVYEKIAAKEGNVIAARIQALWIKLDAVGTFDELPLVYKESVTEIDELIGATKNPVIKYVLKSIKNSIDTAVTKAITAGTSREEAREFLIAFREEIRTKFTACATCEDPSACGF